MMMTNSFGLVLVRNIKVLCTFDKADVLDSVAVDKAMKIILASQHRNRVDKSSAFVYKKSIDARDRDNIFLIYTIAFSADKYIDLSKSKQLSFVECQNYDDMFCSSKKVQNPPVVVGFGPAGMFCALALAKAGLCPVVIERGADVDTRTNIVNGYWQGAHLDKNTNVQFGEGGAGTFSDGKLLTRINDKLCGFVIKEFVKHGAPDEIMYLAKPHIGTNKLKNVVKNIRNEIISLGGSVRFCECLEKINTDALGRVTSIDTSKGAQIQTDALFLCIGHSARDTVKRLMLQGVTVKPKPFSVGVRIEHLQSDINSALYGNFSGAESLGQASYALSHRFDNRAVYSFCMCPGGTVVASASDDGEIVTNGMSNYERDGKNANSAIAVSVDTADYGNTVDGAIEFQQSIEHRAFEAAGGDGTAPIQTLGDFLSDRLFKEPSKILPSYTGKTKLCRAKDIFPTFIVDNLKKGISSFEKELSGFSNPSAVLTFPETRTSSPVRIPRNEEFLAYGFLNLYPCGEGAGYAGGITSAAVDGLRCALNYINN